jgi:hypothetical protein
MLNIGSIFQRLRQTLLVVLLAALLFLPSFFPSTPALAATYQGRERLQTDNNADNNSLKDKVLGAVQNDRDGRPKTTGEWNKEAREVEGSPGERLERIGKQSAEAVKDFGTVYPDTADRSTSD